MNIPVEVEQIIEDIKSIKIQGATAVAEAAFEGIKIFLEKHEKDVSRELLLEEVEQVGFKLATARPNEPLARNGLKYLLRNFKMKYPDLKDLDEIRLSLIEVMKEFENILESSKSNIVNIGVENFKGLNGVLTHCHSSTAENVIKGVVKSKGEHEWFSVVATETRPRYQGRITAKNLSDDGIETLMIVDSAVTSFLSGDWNADDIYGDWGSWDIPVDAVFIGCDEISVNGDTINKVGSYGIALSAYYRSKPVYVIGTLMKVNSASVYTKPKIEMRCQSEIWEDAPKNVRIINPAFEIIPHEFVTGFVTEYGIIKPEDLEEAISENCDWLW